MTPTANQTDVSAQTAMKPEKSPRERIRQDKFATLHLPCFMPAAEKAAKA